MVSANNCLSIIGSISSAMLQRIIGRAKLLSERVPG